MSRADDATPNVFNHSASPENQGHAFSANEGLSPIEQYFDRFSSEKRRWVLDMLLDCLPGEKWFEPGALMLLADYRDDRITWGYIATIAKQRGIYPPTLENAIDEYRRRRKNASNKDVAPESSLQIINAETLRKKEFPPEQPIVKGILPPGCTLFVGRSKDGKSFLAYGLAVAVATGGVALGAIPVLQGDVLYLALEDGERRAQKRLQAQYDLIPDTIDLSRLDLVLWDAPILGGGLEEALATWIAAKPNPRLIIIDILEKVRPRSAKNGNAYAEAYAATSPLTRLAQEHNIAILVVHHVNKIRPDDIRDAISGPISLLGGADTFWILRRSAGEADATLSIGGRDVADQELAMRFKDGFWTILGGAEEYSLSKTRTAILRHLSECGRAQTPKQLNGALPEIGYENLKKTLNRMAMEGQLVNLGGCYVINPSCPMLWAGKESHVQTKAVPAIPRVPGIPAVPTVPQRSRDSANSFPVPGNDMIDALKTNGLGDCGNKGTSGIRGIPDEIMLPLCDSCGSDDLVKDAQGFYCVVCRQRTNT